MCKFSFVDAILLIIAFIISYEIYKGEGLAVFYGFIFIGAILFAIRLFFKDGITFKRFKRNKKS